jgi:hypothetical protein
VVFPEIILKTTSYTPYLFDIILNFGALKRAEAQRWGWLAVIASGLRRGRPDGEH